MMKTSAQLFTAKLYILHFYSSEPAACYRDNKICQQLQVWADHLWGGSRSAQGHSTFLQGLCWTMLYNWFPNTAPLSAVTRVQPQMGERKWDKEGVSAMWPCTAGVWRKWRGTRTTTMVGFLFFHALSATFWRHSLSLTDGYCRVNCPFS